MAISRKPTITWETMRWPLGAAAVAAGIVLSGYRVLPPPASCPNIGILPAIVIGMLVATSGIHAWVTCVQADLAHSNRISAWCSRASERRLLMIALGALLTASTLLVEILLWAWVYRQVGAIEGLEDSWYFSGITFTTFGYGDITLATCWRLLSVGEAINGVLMAGWSTAQLIYLVQRMMTMHVQSKQSSVD